MGLGDWMKSQNLTDSAFGARVEASQQHINRVRRGVKQASPALARRIVAFTGGAVTLADLYPAPTAEDAA